MVNKQSRSPGEVLRFEPEARISGDVPSAAVYTGQAWEALAGVAGSLSSKLGQLADQAIVRERTEQGLSVGRAAGEATLAVSGGSTPKAFFEALCERFIAWADAELAEQALLTRQYVALLEPAGQDVVTQAGGDQFGHPGGTNPLHRHPFRLLHRAFPC